MKKADEVAASRRTATVAGAAIAAQSSDSVRSQPHSPATRARNTAISTGSEPRQRRSAPRIAEIVADELRRQILNGELADGDLLPRQELLVDQFNVSLVSLREALRILDTEGLISVRRGNRGGAVVHAPAKTSAAYMLGMVLQSENVQLTDLGIALQQLEPTCVALAAMRPDRADTLVPALIEINESMAENLDDARAVTETGRAFHDLIVRGCGNHTMIAVVGSLDALWTGHEQRWADATVAAGTYPSMAFRQASLKAHVRITEMIALGNADKARRLAERHIADTQAFVLSEDDGQPIVARSPIARPGENWRA